MSHIALYRAWRPQAFKDVVGQRHIVQTLQNSLKDSRFTHAYLFSGPRGTGKTSAAKILAKALNCETGPAPEPCNACPACRGITEGSVLDVVEIDAASNRGVEEIRDIRDKVKYAPTEVRYKVYIIDEVHMLTTEAFNALLKTLEEPPPHVVFILATTEPGRIPATIISRCQRFDFRRVELEDQLARLQHICNEEAIDAEPEALQLLARLSDGGMRDALSMLDQVISFGGQQITYQDVLNVVGGLASEQFAQLAEALQHRDVGKVLDLIDQFMQEGKSAEQCLDSLIHYFRDLLLLLMVPNAQAKTNRILDSGQFSNLRERFNHQELFQMIDTLNHYQVEMRYSQQPKLLLEIAMMKICAMPAERLSDGMGYSEMNVQSSTVSDSSAGTSHEAMVAKQLELEKKLAALEQRIENLSTGASVAAGSEVKRNPVHLGERSVPTRSQQAGSAAALGSVGRSPSVRPLSIQSQQFADFMNERESARTKHVLAHWNQVLQRVREARVTVHAWLVDGEPVSATEDSVLVAFKNTIHRETTEKPTNKQLIEQVMRTVFQSEMSLATVLMKDWNEALASRTGESAEETSEPLELQYPEPSGDTSMDSDKKSEHHEKDWIKEAIDLFGEDLVEVQEDS